MKIEDLVEINYDGWYVDSNHENIITLRSDYTEDNLAEIYIKLEGENQITVSYSATNGQGIFFQDTISTKEEVSERTINAANEYFDYE